MEGNKKKRDGPDDGPPSKKPKHASGHKLSQKHSSVSSDWDTHLGYSIDHFSPLHLPMVRAVLQRYRHIRTENPIEKQSKIATVIAEEVKAIWEKAWIPHDEDLVIYKTVLKAIDMWVNSSRRPQNRAKAEFQTALDSLLDIRPHKLKSIEALEKHLRMSRNQDWEEDLAFFKGQMKVSLL